VRLITVNLVELTIKRKDPGCSGAEQSERRLGVLR
jgi:hypothetical protein